MKLSLAMCALLGWLSCACAQPTNSFPLWPEAAPGALGTEDKDIPTLTSYFPDPTRASGAAIVICPGGGYANLASHEVTEATTDPEGTAWWQTTTGEEIGDLCAWIFGSADWDGGLANQQWNGHYYDLQLEYDNHVAGCVKVGP